MNNNVIESMAVNGMETEKEGDITMEKPYRFRALAAKDIPLLTNVIRSIGLKELMKCFSKETVEGIVATFREHMKENAKAEEAEEAKESNYITLGISVFPVALEVGEILLENIEKCQTALFKLLARTSNLSVEDVENLSIPDFAGMVFDFVKKDEFTDFFKVVLKSFKSEN